MSKFSAAIQCCSFGVLKVWGFFLFLEDELYPCLVVQLGPKVPMNRVICRDICLGSPRGNHA